MQLSRPVFGCPAAEGPDPCFLIVHHVHVSKPGSSLVFRSSILTACDKAAVVTDTKEISATELDRHLCDTGSAISDEQALSGFGAVLADMVLPISVHTLLKSMKDKHIVVVHDAATSRIPWEAMCLDDWFPAAGAGLSRKYDAENLSADRWLVQRRLGDALELLLIVNPTLDLARAEVEGDRIREVLAGYSRAKIHELRGRAATWSAVRHTLRSGLYDVVHCASHALFDPHDRLRSGIVCHGGKVLSGVDLDGMDGFPVLAVINACEAGRVPHFRKQTNGAPPVGRALPTHVGLAEALLSGGIANYVGTNWPLRDAAAKSFAETFYPALIEGKLIGQALSLARQRIRAERSIDWANYIHYGSYSFAFRRG